MDEAGSFSDAADLAAMTQANVSKHIKALEDQIGTTLFLRTPQGAVITEVGMRLRDYIRNMETLQSRFLAGLHGQAMTEKHRVSCAMPASCLLLPRAVALFHRQQAYAELCINVHLIRADRIIERVMDGSVDLGVSIDRVEHDGLDYIPLCKEEYVAAGSPTLNIAALDADSLLQYNFISHPEFGFYFRCWRYHFFPERSRTRSISLKYGGRATSIHDAVLMVVNGLGVSLFPRHCIDTYLREGKLQEYRLPGRPVLLNDLHLVRLNNLIRPQGLDLVVSLLAESSD
ncbi:regulatory protein, LysR [Alcanivorax sp. S71-1-4]|nr:regulatory protein, LysR [Alcanivorax sp. S71-1-4]